MLVLVAWANTTYSHGDTLSLGPSQWSIVDPAKLHLFEIIH